MARMRGGRGEGRASRQRKQLEPGPEAERTWGAEPGHSRPGGQEGGSGQHAPGTAVQMSLPISMMPAQPEAPGLGGRGGSQGWRAFHLQRASNPTVLGQEKGGSRGRARHTFYICRAIIFKCLGCKPETRSPDSQALLRTL